jgi:uncharacterized protein YfbU (UPF0304 family)
MLAPVSPPSSPPAWHFRKGSCGVSRTNELSRVLKRKVHIPSNEYDHMMREVDHIDDDIVEMQCVEILDRDKMILFVISCVAWCRLKNETIDAQDLSRRRNIILSIPKISLK